MHKMSYFSKKIISWQKINGRNNLPWQAKSPYHIWISEIMLQQTQASRVIEKYHVFLNRFPDPTSCANSSPGEVIELWSGLGYNRRAINLHQSAKVISTKYQGVVPNELQSLLELPGIGDYTARAILAFSFEKDVAVVDVNVKRVFSRLKGKVMSMKEAQVNADQNLPAGEGWRWNQAMIEVGATPVSYTHLTLPTKA